jgi:hypothetical protein
MEDVYGGYGVIMILLKEGLKMGVVEEENKAAPSSFFAFSWVLVMSLYVSFCVDALALL